jgi:hypothetical protein
MKTFSQLWRLLAEVFLEWLMFQTKVLEEIKTHTHIVIIIIIIIIIITIIITYLLTYLLQLGFHPVAVVLH